MKLELKEEGSWYSLAGSGPVAIRLSTSPLLSDEDMIARLLQTHGKGLTASQIRGQLNLPKTATYRAIQDLCDRGLVEKESASYPHKFKMKGEKKAV